MAGPKCAFNSATALRRVFMPSNLGASDCLHVTRIFVPALVAPSSPQQVRAYSYWDANTNRPAGTWGMPSFSNAYLDTAMSPAPARKEKKPLDENRPGPRVKTKMARLPRDDEIRQAYVHIKEEPGPGEEDDGQLSDALDLKSVLAGLDRKTQSLHVIAMPEPGNPQVRWPICRIVNKKEELAKLQFEKQQQKKQKATSKQKDMEINWVVGPHDLEHKLKQLQRFLAKGYKVQVLLLKKVNAKVKAKDKEAKALLEKIEQATAEVQGSKEWKKREGELLRTMKIFLQGHLQSNKPQEKTKEAAQDSEKDAEMSSA